MKMETLTAADEKAICQWPAYSGELATFNYAIAEDGWLSEYPERSGNHRFASWDGNIFVGFAILTETAPREAEFYIAVRADLIDRGYGRTLTELVLAKGFDELGLLRIHLKVRKWHTHAIELYESLGFVAICEQRIEINHESDLFVRMEIFSKSKQDSRPTTK